MDTTIEILDVGRKPYEAVLHIQESFYHLLIDEKRKHGHSVSEMKLILCEHNPVFTLGKSGDEANLLPLAKNSGATFYRATRGGDITYHGPGQLVGYPILDLERLGIGLAKYIYLLEEAAILTLESYGIDATRLDGEAGVWLDTDLPGKTRKICAIGVKASRWVTMHGFAFNVNTDLKYFDMINPCGFTDKGVTSLEKELRHPVDFSEFKSRHTASLLTLLKGELVTEEEAER